jgi:hypothetical protein
MAVLSHSDLAFFEEHGYLVLPHAVPPENLQRSMAAVYAFLGGPEPANWYQDPHVPHGFLPMYHHPALWGNRQSPRIYEAFAQLLGNPHLWVSVDRVSVKLPMHPDHPGWSDRNFMHWDCDPRQPAGPLRLQGVLSLTDTPAGQGGFQCIPGAHKQAWRDTFLPRRAADWMPMHNDSTGELIGTPIPTKAGDLIIWNNLLPHGNCPNTGTAPRYAQYILMHNAKVGDTSGRQVQVAEFHSRHKNGGFPLEPRQWEAQNSGGPTELTPLGRKLLGLDAW